MISTLNIRSDYHNSCEDSIYVEERGNIISGGIFDGCSSGEKSHWASQTLSYLFQSYDNPTTLGTLVSVVAHLRNLKEELNLSEMNFLSTCLLFYFNKDKKELKLRMLGDGIYFVNQVEYEIDQNNTPDYIGYLLTQENYDVDMKYFNKYPVLEYRDVNSFQICSDGLKQIKISQFNEEPENKDPMALLLHPPTSKTYLPRMWNKLKRDGYILGDDLSIISYVNE